MDYRGYKKHQDKSISQNTPGSRADSASGLALQHLSVSQKLEQCILRWQKLFKNAESTGSQMILVSTAISVGSTVSRGS